MHGVTEFMSTNISFAPHKNSRPIEETLKVKNERTYQG
jgi:hypothetical protein